jgi:ATP-dependent helicase/nuclease subunit B
LDALIKRLNEQGQDIIRIEDKQLIELLRQQISRLLIEHPFISHFARRSAHNMFIINSATEILEDCVLSMAEMIRAGKFRPKLSEASFGGVEKKPAEGRFNHVQPSGLVKLGEYEIQLPGGRLLALDGIIDRIDIAELEGKNVAIIFDYKRKEQTFNWSEFYYGLDMQLPIYLLAVKNSSYPTGMIDDIAGAFYMPVEIDVTLTTFGELQNMEGKFRYKAKGIFNGEYARYLEQTTQSGWSKFYNFFILQEGEVYGHYHKSSALKPDDFDRVLKFTRNKSIDLAEKIVCGKIDVKPYWLNGVSPCRYCEYRSVCRFDWQINDYNFLEPVNKLGVLENIDINNG